MDEDRIDDSPISDEEPSSIPAFLVPSAKPADETESPEPERPLARPRPSSRPLDIEKRRAKRTQRPASKPKRRRRQRARRSSPSLMHTIGGWWNRLFSVMLGGSWEDEPRMYESGRGGRDYLLNTLGSVAWGALFPLLTIVATQLAGTERAGEFNMAFTTATLLMFVGMYGVKTYQVSDIEETHAFKSYQIQRGITCLSMLVLGAIYCGLRGYRQDMLLICGGAFVYRAIDALADTYEARLQQCDKLYLAGVSQAARSVAGVTLFSLLLLITRDLAVASIAMAVGGLASFLLITAPLTRLETPPSRAASALEIREIMVECLPSFLALFLFNLIESVPKYAMEGVLPYENQVFFSALFFPAQAMLMVVGFVYKPQLVRLANIWADEHKRRRFDIVVLTVALVAIVVTGIGLAGAHWLFVPMNSLLYGADFEPFRKAQYLMVIAGGLSALADFLYQIITVLRMQAMATRAYLAATALAVVASVILVRLMGFEGAILSYLLVMAVLTGALATEYVLARVRKS